MKNTYKQEFNILSQMPKELVWIGDPILKKKCRDIAVKDIKSVETKKIIAKMISVLKKIRKFGRGVALAAPQVGILKSVIVVMVDGKYVPFINPKIIKFSDELTVYPEVCLSILPLAIDVVRPKLVSVSYYDANGVFHKEDFDVRMSRALQHEIDHLNGILCTEKGGVKTARYIFNWDEFKKTAKVEDYKK